MKNTKFSVLLTMIFCALVAHAQDTPPDASWDADPLDVLEPKKQPEVVEPTVPEFKEIPEPGSEAATPKKKKKKSEEAQESAPTTDLAPAQSVPAAGSNDPDFAKEAQFNHIYKKFNEQPTAVEAWDKAVGKRASETYQVQKGNTLWDISNTFFGDPNFWPKIWSFNNGAIGNPHEIDPSMTIRFFPGNADEAPTVELTESSDKETVVDASKGTTTTVGIPAAKKKHIPVLKSLPASLPSRRFGIFNDEEPKVEVQIPPKTESRGLEYLGYYLTDAPISCVEVVTGTELDLKSAGDFVYIYVRLDQGSGKDFIVEKNLAFVDDPRKKNRKGQMVEIQGQIEVLERVNEQKNIYRAIVKKAIQPVEVGSLLIPGQLPMIDPTMTPPTASGTGARIIGGQFGANRQLFAANQLVFLDGGSAQGLTEGESFPIFADEAVRNRQTDAYQNDRQIGVAKIVKVSSNFSTAYVTKSTDDIYRGDYVGHVTKQAVNIAPVETPEKMDPSPSTGGNDDLEKDFEMDSAPAKGDSGGTPEVTPAEPSGSGTDDSDLTL